MNHARRWIGVSVSVVFSAAALLAEPIIKDGQKLAFLGDSITQQGAGQPSGYVRLVVSGLEANGIKVEPVFAGIGGHKSNDMLARLDRDVLGMKPDFMTLSCGVNDVWHGERGVPLEAYKKNITEICDKAQAAGTKVVVLTATMILEDQANANNQKLVAYNDFLRTLAKARKLPLADLNADMQAAVLAAKAANAPKPNKSNYLTSDGVHMAPPGDQLMAEGVLRALGLDAGQLAKAKAAWLAIPKATSLKVTAAVSLADYNRLMEKAAKEKKSCDEYVGALLSQAIEGAVK
jgi:lysophospholipase L1-like esterase